MPSQENGFEVIVFFANAFRRVQGQLWPGKRPFKLASDPRLGVGSDFATVQRSRASQRPLRSAIWLYLVLLCWMVAGYHCTGSFAGA